MFVALNLVSKREEPVSRVINWPDAFCPKMEIFVVIGRR